MKDFKYPQHKTAKDILALPPALFIDESYRAILDRDPDKDGRSHYLHKIDSGSSKESVLLQIYKSKESRKTKKPLKGIMYIQILDFWNRLILLKNIPLQKKHRKSNSIDQHKNRVLIVNIDALITHQIIPNKNAFNFNEIKVNNPEMNASTIEQVCKEAIQFPPRHYIKLFSSQSDNAIFYSKLALTYEKFGEELMAREFYKWSLLFCSTALASEHLGNFAVRDNNPHIAIPYYLNALSLKSKSEWVYLNLARSYQSTGRYIDALSTISEGLMTHKGSELLLNDLDTHINAYWTAKVQELDYLAQSQQRAELIIKHNEIATVICEAYQKVFERTKSKSQLSKPNLNTQKVLIIGLTPDAAPQCYRYRIEQKIEQLTSCGYHATTVPWHSYEDAFDLINFNDLIIFYRTPGFPSVLKLLEYAKSLSKVTFYELDDLLFETISVPPIETYGGQLSLETYTSITKDIGSHNAIASKCNFVIASTLPLLNRLSPLCLSQKGFLHRNGTDKHNRISCKTHSNASEIKIFYGSGTLAHNSDFIIEAIPALTKILNKHRHCKLVIMGYLTLPTPFINQFKKQVIQIPFAQSIDEYYEYLSAADINLAVLHNDRLSECKSELKWFEAATFGIPSIVSRTQNYDDVIQNGIDGFIVEGEVAWYTALEKLVESAELRNTIGTKAYIRVKAEYSIQNLALKLDASITNAIHFHQSSPNGSK